MTFASAEAPAAPLCDLRASRPGQGTGAAIASERSPPRSPGAPLFSHFCAPARLPRTLAPDARGVPGANSAARLGAVVEACQLRRPVRRSIALRIAGAQAATARRLRSASRRDFAGRRSANERRERSARFASASARVAHGMALPEVHGRRCRCLPARRATPKAIAERIFAGAHTIWLRAPAAAPIAIRYSDIPAAGPAMTGVPYCLRTPLTAGIRTSRPTHPPAHRRRSPGGR